jgi:hypothetical protein
MAVRGPNKPYATDWKRYQLPFTRLEEGKGLTGVTGTGELANATNGLDVYINDDVFWKQGAFSDIQRHFVMTDDAGGDFIGASANQWTTNKYWLDGTSGATSSRKMRLGTVNNASNASGKALINVGNPDTDSVYYQKRQLLNSRGNNVELITIEPGLHIGFLSEVNTVYASGNKWGFKLDWDYLNNIPRDYNGLWSCWMYVPVSAEDWTVSQNIPTELAIRGFSVLINPIQYGPKQEFTDISGLTPKDFGLSWQVVRKMKGEDWITPSGSIFANESVVIGQIDKDYSIGSTDFEHASMHLPGAAAGAEREQDMRLEINFPSITLAEATMQAGQYIQVVLSPH